MTAPTLSALGLALATMVVPALAYGQGSGQPATTRAERAEPDVVPDGALGRIQRGLSQVPTVDLERELVRFYARTVAEQPPLVENPLGDADLQYGPRRGGPAFTHSEFLSMVTPQELYSQAGFGAAELLQAALVNWLSQAMIEKAFDGIREARTETELREIRDRIDRELEEINQRTRDRQQPEPPR